MKNIMKNKFYYLVLAAGLVLITVSLVRKHKGGPDVADVINNDAQKQEVKTEEENVAEKSYLEGVLYKSEDPNRGSLKLSSNYGDIYLKTSRDFSALIGLEVLVRISGTKDKFELVDVQPKVAKDGFIKQQ